jgi:hypothetical protein
LAETRRNSSDCHFSIEAGHKGLGLLRRPRHLGWLASFQQRSQNFLPSGPLPNDLINEISIKRINSDEMPTYLIELSIDSVDDSGERMEVAVKIQAERMHLGDRTKPGVAIED